MKFSDVTTLEEVAKRYKINYHTLRYRLKRRGVRMMKKNGIVLIDRKDISKKVVSK